MIIATMRLKYYARVRKCECVLTGIVTCIVKSKLSVSPKGQHLFTRSGNQDNEADIINISKLYLEGGFLLS